MNECSAYVGLDVHKDTIAVAVALPGREEPVYRDEVNNQRKSLLRLIRGPLPEWRRPLAGPRCRRLAHYLLVATYTPFQSAGGGCSRYSRIRSSIRS